MFSVTLSSVLIMNFIWELHFKLFHLICFNIRKPNHSSFIWTINRSDINWIHWNILILNSWVVFSILDSINLKKNVHKLHLTKLIHRFFKNCQSYILCNKFLLIDLKFREFVYICFVFKNIIKNSAILSRPFTTRQRYIRIFSLLVVVYFIAWSVTIQTKGFIERENIFI